VQLFYSSAQVFFYWLSAAIVLWVLIGSLYVPLFDGWGGLEDAVIFTDAAIAILFISFFIISVSLCFLKKSHDIFCVVLAVLLSLHTGVVIRHEVSVRRILRRMWR